MKKLIFAVCFILSVHTFNVFGQTMMGPFWLYDNHHLTDKYIINPAFAGNQKDPKVFVNAQRMTVQLREAPSVHIVGAHTQLGNKRKKFRYNTGKSRNAVGGLVFADNNGPYQSIGLKLDYAYFVPLAQDNACLSFGLGGMLFSKRVNLEKYASEWIDDPLIAACMGNHAMVPDVNAGVLLTVQQFFVGFSASQLLENSYQFSKMTYTPAQVFRNFYLMTGYRFEYERFEMEPSIVFGYNDAPASYRNNGNFVDVNLECFLKPAVFVLSYRVDGYITTSLLYRTQNLELGIRSELFPTNKSDAGIIGVGLMASYTFLSSHSRR